MTDYYKRGDIVYANFNPAIGSEQNGIRPALILQNDIGNKYSHTVIVAAITTSHKKELPTHINLNSVDFLESNSTLLLEQIRTIDKDRIQKYVGALSSNMMLAVDHAIAISVGLKSRSHRSD